MIRVVKDSTLNDYIFLILGCFSLAFALTSFLEPREIVIGGATGLAIILDRLTGSIIPLWLGNFLINLPLFALSIKIYGFKFLRRTVFATLFLSFALFITGLFPPFVTDYTISCVFGSLLSGLGVGLILRSNATTGGSDLGAFLLHRYLPNVPISRLMLIIDTIIIALGFFVFGSLPAFYAIIGAYIISKVIDIIFEGVDFAKAVFIVSEKSDLIGKALIDNLERGATKILGEGVYTGQEKNIILCVLDVKQIAKMKEITSQIDENAFVIVADVKEVLGEFARA